MRGEVVHGTLPGDRLESSSVPNALAALLPARPRRLRRDAAHLLRVDRGQPGAQFLRFLLFGQGEVAPVTREVLRRAEPDRPGDRTCTSDDAR